MGGPCDFSGSPSPLWGGLGFGDLGVLRLGLDNFYFSRNNVKYLDFDYSGASVEKTRYKVNKSSYFRCQSQSLKN